MTLLLKDPAAVLDYAVDWGADYLTGDVLTESGVSGETNPVPLRRQGPRRPKGPIATGIAALRLQ